MGVDVVSVFTTVSLTDMYYGIRILFTLLACLQTLLNLYLQFLDNVIIIKTSLLLPFRDKWTWPIFGHPV